MKRPLKKPAAPPSSSKRPSKKLPAALAKNVALEVEAKRERLVKQAQADVALVLRRKEIITDAFLDIADALVRLEKASAHKLYGKASFGAFCEDVLEISQTKARELIDVKRAPRELAVRWGQERTGALLALADATPEADTAESLSTTKLLLPSGKRLDVAQASTRALWDAVKAIRAAHRVGKPRRGLTVSTEERKHVAALDKALRAAKLDAIGATAVANHEGARVRFGAVPLVSLVAFARALLAVRRPTA